MNWKKSALLAFSLSLAGLVFFSIGAYASNISSPFDSGSTWYVCQGYNGPITHSGSSIYALDFTKQLCDGSAQSNTSSTGANVRAPLGGTVYWYGAAYGSMCINTLDSRSIGLTHINSTLKAGAPVTQDQIVGTIGPVGTVGNGGIAHLHMQAWSKPNCSSEPVPFDVANLARICGAPDMTAYGPNTYNNGIWSGTSFIAQPCDNSNVIYRFYSPIVKHHLYTADSNEAAYLQANMRGIWNYEGVAFRVKATAECLPQENVYRFYSESLKTHMYTMDENEKNELQKYPVDMWRYEGIGYCANEQRTEGTQIPIYRFYSDLLQSPFYTMDENEKNELQKYPVDMWRYEGIAYYAYPS